MKAIPSTKFRYCLQYLLSALSGLLLFLSDYPVHAWPLQFIAFIPLLISLTKYCNSNKAAVLAGFILGMFYTLPMALFLKFPWHMAGALAIYLSILWMVFSWGVSRVLSWPFPWNALSAGAVAVLVEWINSSLVPVWGTAQCFARVWSAAPWAIQFVSLTGMLGLVFWLVFTQVLLTQMAFRPQLKQKALLLLATSIILTMLYNSYQIRSSPSGVLKAAAIGWTYSDLEQKQARTPQAIFDFFYQPLLSQAIRQGARVIVSPEVTFRFSANDREPMLQRLQDLAQQNHIMLVTGYFDTVLQQNHLLFIDDRGMIVGDYLKTHLIPFIEEYQAGSGELTVVPLGGFLLGGMICQDDNFTDLARGYGRRRTQLIAVPTNDWAEVKNYHLENSLFRAIENHYAVVRATSNGISAIISPHGKLLTYLDHFQQGPGVIVAEVPLYVGGTIYSCAGDWLAFACFALLGAQLLHRIKKRSLY